MRPLLYCLLLTFSVSATAQTSLSLGDLAFTAINQDRDLAGRQGFSFLLLADVTNGTTVSFTERAWSDANGFDFNNIFGSPNTGGTMRLTFNANYSCGTEFWLVSGPSSSQDFVSDWRAYVTGSTTNAGTLSAVAGLNTEFGLSIGGETIFAYQGSVPIPGAQTNFIAAIHTNASDGSTDANWDTGDPGISNASQKPDAFNGTDAAIRLYTSPAAELDNSEYNCAGVTSGEPDALLAAVHNPANWSGNNTMGFELLDGCGFQCIATCTPPTITSVIQSPNPVCPGDPFTLTINGNLNDATQWTLFGQNDCNGAPIATSTTTTLQAAAAGSTVVHLAGTGGCISTPVCIDFAVSVAGSTPRIAPEVIVSADGVNQVEIPANDPGTGQMGTFSFLETDGNGTVSDSPPYLLNGSSGQSYLVRYSFAGNGCPELADTVLVILANPTPLALGDLAFTGLHTSGQYGFSFTLLRDIEAGTRVTFTDGGWSNTAGFDFLNSLGNVNEEADMELTFYDAAECGSEYYLQSGPNGAFQDDVADWTASNSDGTVAGSLTALSSRTEFGFSASGDQVFAYQGEQPTPADQSGFIAGITSSCGDNGCSELTWDVSPNSSTESEKPSVFNTGEANYAVKVSGNEPLTEPANAKYACTTFIGEPTTLRAALLDRLNWDLASTDITGVCGFNCNAALPITWRYFVGRRRAGAKEVELTWAVTESPDNARFSVLRSDDGTDWKSIAQLSARPGGSGEYRYTDVSPLSEMGYYRLLHTDVSGEVSLSPVRQVVGAEDSSIRIYPNPVSDRFRVDLPVGAALVGIFDLWGGRRSLLVGRGAGGSAYLYVGDLPAGVYVLRVALVNGKRLNRTVVVR